MQYLSPFALFTDNTQDPPDKKAVLLAKKRLFAELELSGNDSIEIGAVPFTKNDIIAWFEELQNDRFFDYHRAIARDKILRSFLENLSIGPGDRFQEDPLYESDDFIRWLSPYFLNAFLFFTDTSFRKVDLEGMAALLANKLLMTETDAERGWAAIEKMLANNIATMEYYEEQCKKDKRTRIPIDKITDLLNYRYINLILLLPENRFSGARNKYAFLTMQVCIEIFNRDTTNREYAKITIENAVLLAVSEQGCSEIAAKAEEMRKITKKRTGRYAIWIVVILVSLLRAFSDTDNSNDIIKNAPVYILPSKDSTAHSRNPKTDSLTDSLIRSKIDRKLF